MQPDGLIADMKTIPLPTGAGHVSYETESGEIAEETISQGKISEYTRRTNVGVANYLTADMPESVVAFYRGELAGEWFSKGVATKKSADFTRTQERFKGVNVSFPGFNANPWVKVDVVRERLRSELQVNAYRVYVANEEITSVRLMLKMR